MNWKLFKIVYPLNKEPQSYLVPTLTQKIHSFLEQELINFIGCIIYIIKNIINFLINIIIIGVIFNLLITIIYYTDIKLLIELIILILIVLI